VLRQVIIDVGHHVSKIGLLQELHKGVASRKNGIDEGGGHGRDWDALSVGQLKHFTGWQWCVEEVCYHRPSVRSEPRTWFLEQLDCPHDECKARCSTEEAHRPWSISNDLVTPSDHTRKLEALGLNILESWRTSFSWSGEIEDLQCSTNVESLNMRKVLFQLFEEGCSISDVLLEVADALGRSLRWPSDLVGTYWRLSIFALHLSVQHTILCGFAWLTRFLAITLLLPQPALIARPR
jgi:hypothetical protein